MGTERTLVHLVSYPILRVLTLSRHRIQPLKMTENGVMWMGNEKHGEEIGEGGRQYRMRLKRCLIFH